MTVAQLVEMLQRQDQGAEVQMAHLMRDRVSIAKFDIAAVVRKEGHVLLCDKDLVSVLKKSLQGGN